MSDKDEKKIINLTPHQINVYIDNKEITYPPSGEICRVEFIKNSIGFINNIEIKQVQMKEVINYPNKEDEIYIVSSIVGMQLAKLSYTNYVVPDTDDAIRDDNGNIIAVKSFIKY